MRRRKTQNIIFFYLFLTLLFFAIITTIAFHINNEKKKIFIQSNTSQIEKSINSAIAFEYNRIHQVVFDYTFWDEMVNCIESKDYNWAKEIIDPAVTTYNVNSISIFDINGNKVYTKNSSNANVLDRYKYSKNVIDSLRTTHFIHFYDLTPLGTIDVYGATVHNSNDLSRKGNPKGFFFIVRLIDNKYINDLSELTTTKVSFINDTVSLDDKIYTARIIKPLAIINSNTFRYLSFEKELPFIEQFNKFSLQFIGLFFLAMVGFIFVFLFLTTRWINKPLKIVSEALELDDISKTKGLEKYGSEFVDIGSLVSLYITQKKTLEDLKNRAEESDRLKSSFMANMSHEIRTPLNGIVGFSELLCSSNINDETTENYRKIIRKCSNNLMRLISDILDYSKIEAGQLVINKEEFSTESLFTELSNHYESKAETLEQKGIHLIFKKTGGVVVFYSDKQRIKQILINLISNSIKFTEHGAIEVDFYTDGKSIVFTVMDTGIGISEEQQQVIFKRFWQANQPKTKLYGGTGLGLALSKGLVELLDGKISVKSKLGYGSIFSIEIPLSKEN